MNSTRVNPDCEMAFAEPSAKKKCPRGSRKRIDQNENVEVEPTKRQKLAPSPAAKTERAMRELLRVREINDKLEVLRILLGLENATKIVILLESIKEIEELTRENRERARRLGLDYYPPYLKKQKTAGKKRTYAGGRKTDNPRNERKNQHERQQHAQRQTAYEELKELLDDPAATNIVALNSAIEAIRSLREDSMKLLKSQHVSTFAPPQPAGFAYAQGVPVRPPMQNISNNVMYPMMLPMGYIYQQPAPGFYYGQQQEMNFPMEQCGEQNIQQQQEMVMEQQLNPDQYLDELEMNIPVEQFNAMSPFYTPEETLSYVQEAQQAVYQQENLEQINDFENQPPVDGHDQEATTFFYYPEQSGSSAESIQSSDIAPIDFESSVEAFGASSPFNWNPEEEQIVQDPAQYSFEDPILGVEPVPEFISQEQQDSLDLPGSESIFPLRFDEMDLLEPLFE